VNEAATYSLTIGAIDPQLAEADGYDTYTVHWGDGTSIYPEITRSAARPRGMTVTTST